MKNQLTDDFVLAKDVHYQRLLFQGKCKQPVHQLPEMQTWRYNN